MKIISSAFEKNQNIPKKYTCEGGNYNPALVFAGIPQQTRSLALVVEDPDTPMGITWYHWLVYNILPESKGIKEHSKPEGAIEGQGSGGNLGYQGPCPPDPKPHRYIFTLYALDKMFDLPEAIDVPKFREAIKGHVIEEAKLTGIYKGSAKR